MVLKSGDAERRGRVASGREQDIETLQVLHQLGLDRLTPYAHARQHGQMLWSSQPQSWPPPAQGGPLGPRAELDPFVAHDWIVYETSASLRLAIPGVERAQAD